MRKKTTVVSECSKNGEGKIKFKPLPRRKQKSGGLKTVKACLGYVFKRPLVLRWAFVHIPDAAAAIEMWGEKAISFLRDIF